MPRPLPDYVPPEIADIVLRKWPKVGLKGLSEVTGIGYSKLVKFFSRDYHVTLLNFERLSDAVGWTMTDLAKLLPLSETQRRQRLKALIHDNYGSIQDLYRDGIVTDGFVEALFRGDVGSRIYAEYAPLCKVLGLSLDDLAVIIRKTLEQRRGS